MIDFEHPQPERGERVAAGVGVEPGAEDHVPADVSRHGERQPILGITTAHDDSRTKRAALPVCDILKLRRPQRSQDANGERIVEDVRKIDDPVHGSSKRRAAPPNRAIGRG